MPDGTFEPRDITIVHQHVWEALERWADQRGMELVPAIPGHDDHLPSYIIVPRAVPRTGEPGGMIET